MFTGPGSYNFSSLHRDGLCLDIPSEIAHKDEGRVQMFPRNGAAYQLWVVAEDPDHPQRYAIHASVGRSKTLGIAGNSTDDYARVHFQRPNGTAFQLWRFEEEGDGTSYRIFNEATGLCLDLREEAKGHGGILQQRPRLDVPNQLWVLTPRTA